MLSRRADSGDMLNEELGVKTSSRTQMVNITPEIKERVERSGIPNGICMIYVPHTTASIIVNEGWDPAVIEDISSYLDERVPWKGPYRHSEGNSAAHIKASILGHSAQVPIVGGKLRLGTWQSIFFCEFDGPRSRKVNVSLFEA